MHGSSSLGGVSLIGFLVLKVSHPDHHLSKLLVELLLENCMLRWQRL